MSLADSLLKTGTALDLCIVAMPNILVPVYCFGSFGLVLPTNLVFQSSLEGKGDTCFDTWIYLRYSKILNRRNLIMFQNKIG